MALFYILYFPDLELFLALPGGTPIVSPTHTSSQMPGRLWWRQRCTTYLSHCSYCAAASITVGVPFFFSSTKNIFPFFKFRRIFLLKCHIDSDGDKGVQQTIWRSTDNVTARRPIRQQTDITLCNSPISDDWFHATIFFIFHQNKNNCWCSIANFLKGNFYTKYSRWKLRTQKIF